MKGGWRTLGEISLKNQQPGVLMPSSRHEEYREFVQHWVGSRRNEPEVVAALARHAGALRVLWELDLEPARPILKQGYAKTPRGAKVRDPVIMLRALLLSLLVGQPKINKWVRDVKASRVLQVLGGIGLDGLDGVPGVGTFYDFMHRINNGPIRRSCSHIERPSDDERRRAASAKARQRPKAKDRRAMKSKQGRKELGKRRPAKNVTVELVSLLKEQKLEPNANDLLGRLSQVLIEVAVKVSAQKGLLGDLEALSVSGDGTPLKSGASRHGRRVCDCAKQKRCDCPRRYTDPDANIGWDSHRERFFFGHHLYEIVVCSKKHDLPLALRLDPGSTSDFVAVLKTVEHLRKSFSDSRLAKLKEVMLDAGHDGEEIYRFLIDHDIFPLIPLKQPAPPFHPTRKDIALSRRGVPQCEAGAEMVLWAKRGKQGAVYVCPVKAGQLELCPQAPPSSPSYRCRPVDKLAPTVTIKINDNPRLCPPLPRNHRRFARLMKLRSGSERSFSVKKQRFLLEQAGHCRRSFWLIRLHMIAVLQHALAWVAKEDALAFLRELCCSEPDRLAA
jgi:hypothetical protein